MTIEQRIDNLEKKLDAILSILGHGRTKTHAEIQREAIEKVEYLRLKQEKRRPS